MPASGLRSSAGCQNPGEFTARRLKSGNQAEQNRGENAQSQREHDDAPIQMNFLRSRKLSGSLLKQSAAPGTKRQAEQTARDRQTRGFQQEFSDELRPAGAQREPNRYVPFALAGP